MNPSVENAAARLPIWDEGIADRVAEHLLATGSYLIDMVMPRGDWYTWKSGIRAPCYCNCRYLNRSAEASDVCAEYLAQTIREKFPDAEIIVGLAAAGIAWSARVASKLELPMSFTRSQPKGHGVGGLVDANPNRGTKAVIVDDLCASGGSLIKAVEALKSEYDIETIGIAVIVSWGFQKMWSNLDPLGIPLYSLTSYPSILKAARSSGLITTSHEAQLNAFYRSPATYDWPDLAKGS